MPVRARHEHRNHADRSQPVVGDLQATSCRRRTVGGFPGAERVFAQQQNGVARKRVGLLPKERTPVREGAEIVNEAGEIIGSVCSGGFGPTLGGPLAMGYLDSAYVTLDTPVWAIVRGKKVQMLVSKMPFVPQRYYRG